MKTKSKALPLIAATYCGLCAVGSAFSLDFLSVALGTQLNPSLTVNVPSYGDVLFTELGTSQLVVDDAFALTPPSTTTPTSPSLTFDSFESVRVTFQGATPIKPIFSFVGVDAGENFVVSKTADPKVYTVLLNNTDAPPSTETAGLYTISFTAVPEPSASLLGALGATLLVIRRRR